SGHRCVCQGARPFVVTHLRMGSSSCHPFRRLGALTGALRPPAAICPSFDRYSPLPRGFELPDRPADAGQNSPARVAPLTLAANRQHISTRRTALDEGGVIEEPTQNPDLVHDGGLTPHAGRNAPLVRRLAQHGLELLLRLP